MSYLNNVYIFFRDGHFYSIGGIENDAEALENVALNPGTTRVEHMASGRVVFDLKTNEGKSDGKKS